MSESIFDRRRANLTELIADKYQGNRSAFSRATNKNVNLINLCLTTNDELRRNIGEKLARMIERDANLPEGWLDEDHRHGATVHAVPRLRSRHVPGDMVIDALYVGVEWLRTTIGATDIEKLSLWHVHDDTMSPTIDSGDVVFIDTSQDQRGGAGPYLIEHDGLQEIRRLQLRPDGSMSITPDNRLYEGATVDAKRAGKMVVIGRVVARLHTHTL